MPDKEEAAVKKKAERDLERGKSPSTAAGEFVKEEIEHVREGKHGAASPKQAIAIGLSKARRAGVPLEPPHRGKASAKTRASAARAYEIGQGERAPRAPSRRRSRATERALERQPRGTASHAALGTQARSASAKRSRADRSRAAKQAAATKGHAKRSEAARKAARTRHAHA